MCIFHSSDPEFRVFLVLFNNFKEDPDSIEQYESSVIINELQTFDNLHVIFV